MYLIDTNVISEARKGRKANSGVQHFFSDVAGRRGDVFLSVVTIGKLRRGIELVRYWGDGRQARQLEAWLASILTDYHDHVLEFDADTAQVWGGCVYRIPKMRWTSRLRPPH